MKILVVGGGGREHAILRKLKENPEVTELYAAPGNGGIGYDAVRVPISATDVEAIAKWCSLEGMDYVVVAPDDPLALGLVDLLEERGIPAFGPNRAAARIEASKAFAKDLMRKYHIPTAAYETFTEVEQAKAYLEQNEAWPIVVKADGLALGKGVLICQDRAEAIAAVEEMMVGGKFGASGATVVIEEFLTGPEVSVLSITDGKTLVPMVSSMDHKRALDGDRGLNTGGMGTVAPNLHPGNRRRVHGEDFSAHHGGHERRGADLQGLSLLRADAHPQGAQGHRVQLPLRRPGDPGGAPPAGDRPLHRHAGGDRRHVGGAGRDIL